MNDKMRPALIGGAVLGILSAIPFVNFVNACCCAWAILGGLLASYLYIKSSAKPVSIGEGALLGVLAGLVGTVIYVVLGVPMGLAVGSSMMSLAESYLTNLDPSQADLIRQQMEQSQTFASVIINAIMVSVLLVIFSTIGGLLGVPIFEKRKDGGAGAPPPPPPNFSGPYGNTAYNPPPPAPPPSNYGGPESGGSGGGFTPTS